MANLPNIDNGSSPVNPSVASGAEQMPSPNVVPAQAETAEQGTVAQHAQEILADSQTPFQASNDFYTLKWQNRGSHLPE